MTILTVFLTAFLSIPALAQKKAADASAGKVATVDMQKIFKGYWKTKQAQASLNERKTQFDKDEKGMLDALKKAGEEYQHLLAQANDQAVSANERNKRKQAADDKLKRIQDSKAALEQFDRQIKTTLTDQMQQMSDNIYSEIKAAVAARSKTAGCSLVLDTSAQAISDAISIKSPVIYNDSNIDLTDDVLKQLNAGAPIDSAPVMTAPSPEVKTEKH